ncbi:hypothetical protein [Alkalicoccus halolimnae]|uniref:Uncharacterized protein n=1 Tax=Alkalicoccus halolimnae TaxID=1667239 RepID=A0AAJ8N202_9BACI|nr:hypothetical protein [Alkalicoccus halolimnae]
MIVGIFVKKMIGLLVFEFILADFGNGDSANSSGNSGNWGVSYEADISNGDMETNTGTIEYTGEEQAPETIDYNSGHTEGKICLMRKRSLDVVIVEAVP